MQARTLLLFSVLLSVALAQRFGGARCLCRRVRDKTGPPKNILDIQIYPPSNTCDSMEVVVSLKNGLQYCLDPRLQKVQDMITNLKSMKAQLRGTSTPEP
ncbi:C-X-C motif chemokine 6-like isoform X2 [Brienomyrus brachyistius]|uniref:C-X-C motif chemokine 6-like isoform X2 n=1 Tax=Brienomyrus brachyistius TaxID=42636 RepID=UPI0020B26606|nr:C-X-C motif chemokine 6-like isoform X2 [Brienomyrus brachyistius]